MADYFLSKGSHDNAEAGRCAMEWVSYLAAEPHSDQPVCVSPVLRRFCIALNDRLDDEERQRLRPFLARTIGTAGDGMDEERVRMCSEFLLRRVLPLRLDAAGRGEAAQKLRDLPAPLTLEATDRALEFARNEAWDARRMAVDRLAVKIRAELAKRGDAAAAAAAVAVAVAVAAAVADAVAVAVAAADAAAAAAAVAVAAADADAVAAAVAAAVADAVAVAAADDYWAIRAAIREKVRALAVEMVREQNRELTVEAFELLDRMLPTELVQLPVVDGWREVCGVA